MRWETAGSSTRTHESRVEDWQRQSGREGTESLAALRVEGGANT